MIFFFCCGYIFSAIQAPLQAFLRPGLWLPGIRALHRKREKWILNTDVYTSFDQVMKGLEQMKMWSLKTYGAHEMKIYKVDDETMFIQMFFLTPIMQWLDIVEIEIRPGQFSGSEVLAHSFSSGILPICLPLAFILNMVLFFCPFWDWGKNNERLIKIREFINMDIEQVEFVSNC